MQLALRQNVKKKRAKMNVRPSVRVRSPEHLRWIKTHKCLVDDCDDGPIDPHHVGDAATAGMALKSDDYLTVPLCRHHHIDEVHGINKGAKWFETEYDLDLREAALWFAERSPDQAIKDAVRECE